MDNEKKSPSDFLDEWETSVVQSDFTFESSVVSLHPQTERKPSQRSRNSNEAAEYKTTMEKLVELKKQVTKYAVPGCEKIALEAYFVMRDVVATADSLAENMSNWPAQHRSKFKNAIFPLKQVESHFQKLSDQLARKRPIPSLLEHYQKQIQSYGQRVLKELDWIEI